LISTIYIGPLDLLLIEKTMTPAKLKKIAVDALEDIKAKDIKVMDVKHLSTLFDFIIVASADSSRQTKALANNVVVKVKQAGGHVLSTEGEETGEWVLVDCGDVIVHVMHPLARAYYNLEELWDQPLPRSRKQAAEVDDEEDEEEEMEVVKKPKAKKAAAKKSAAEEVEAVEEKIAVTRKKAAAKKPVAKKSVAKKAVVEKVAAKKVAAKKPVAKKPASKTRVVAKTAVKKTVAKKVAKKA
jgi:ribosome-associated protein